jgi:hypothetical protein
MNFEIITTQPLWFIVFCIMLGGLYSWVLYRRNEFGENPQKREWPVVLMSIFRFLSATFLAFLLLSPLVKYINKQLEKPIIVIAVDNSESVPVNKDSAFYNTEYHERIKKLADELSADYRVETYSFGAQVKPGLDFSFGEKQTNLARVFDEVENNFDNQNLGAVIIASDGIFNQGYNPLYSSSNLKIPVFTIALGDSNLQRDVLIDQVKHNRMAYLGNTFPLQIELKAFKAAGENTVVTVSREGKVLFRREQNIGNDKFLSSIPVQLKAESTGLQHYVVTVSTVKNEISYVNNRKDIFIDVLNGRQKVMLLANAPHPDLAAFKQSIESNENYELEIRYAETFTPTDYNLLTGKNLVILHMLPSEQNPMPALFKKIKESKVPALIVLGNQTSIPLFNNAELGLNIQNYRNNSNDATPIFNKDFTLFNASEQAIQSINTFPPLKVPFGTYRLTSENRVLLQQKIGYVETEQPLLVFNQDAENRTGLLCGEGIWRWRLQDYQNNQNHNAINELLTKTVQYLSARDDKRLFRVNSDKNIFFENEHIILNAEVYNESYELVNTPDVDITIKNQEGKSFSYIFSKSGAGYTLDAGVFPVGNYSYQARVTLGGKKSVAEGRFAVKPLQVELLQTVADHDYLYRLAARNGGQLYYPRNTEQLAADIRKRKDIKTVSYNQLELKDMIHLKWIFFVLLGLLCAEWFLRKRNGSY